MHNRIDIDPKHSRAIVQEIGERRRAFQKEEPELPAIECTQGRRSTRWKTRIFSTFRLPAAASAFNIEGHLSD
jgi:hypothetical protein